MNPEQQRIAIAEAVGKWHSGWPHEYMNQSDRLRHIPNYLNDLNAMHCAEEMLADDQWVEYRENIRTVVLGPVRYVSQWCKADIHSTAAQRAEAFLRTIGKWEESK
jgi:hypothetical protein